MKCPRCGFKTGRCATGDGKLDFIVACYACAWQVAIRELENWLKRWGYRK